MKESELVNFSDRPSKRRVMERIQRLEGLHEVSITRHRATRSLRANAFYWAAINQPFTLWLRDQYGDPTITKEQAHEVLKRQVLGVKEKMLDTGEVLELIPTTHDMNVEEFTLFIDKATLFLGEFCNIEVLPAEMFYEARRAS